MRKVSQIPHHENWDFDRVLYELDHPKNAHRREIKGADRAPYSHTKLEKELKDAKDRNQTE